MTRYRKPHAAITALLVLIAVYVIGGWGLALFFGVGDRFSFFLYSRAVASVTFMLFTLFVGWRFVRIAFGERPARPAATLIRDVRARLFTRDHLMHAAPLFAGFLFFMSAFTSLKAMIPVVHPYLWDETFAALDRAIHFGIDPWRILQPVLGYPWITSAINIAYNLWFPVMFSVLYWQLFDLSRPALRLRFFWTFFLTWMVNGTVLAMILSSAGPCFYGQVVQGPNPYADQMSYLSGLSADYPVWAVATQTMLWHSYESSTIGLGSGISAMPSVHVAMAGLFALLARRYKSGLRIFFAAFFLVIMAGSVHLGWHYAIDGYAGAFVTLAIWWAAGRVFKEEETS